MTGSRLRVLKVWIWVLRRLWCLWRSVSFIRFLENFCLPGDLNWSIGQPNWLKRGRNVPRVHSALVRPLQLFLIPSGQSRACGGRSLSLLIIWPASCCSCSYPNKTRIASVLERHSDTLLSARAAVATCQQPQSTKRAPYLVHEVLMGSKFNVPSQ